MKGDLLGIPSRVLRVLIVEDNPFDAGLNEREIQRALSPCTFQRVETEEDFLKALDEFQPDIIVSDYAMPSFDGMKALLLALEKTPLTPFIVVTGSMNEDTAVECMRKGAANYVIKQHLKRLGPAVIHALEEKKMRMERIAAEAALVESEEKYRSLVEIAGEAIYVAQDGVLKFANQQTVAISGRTREELASRPFIDFVYPDDREMVLERYIKRLQGFEVPSRYSFRIVHSSGETRWVELNTVVIGWAGKPATLNFLSDITERKRSDEAMINLNERLKAASDEWRITFDSASELIIRLDMERNIVKANLATAKYLGKSFSELIGKKCHELFHLADAPLPSCPFGTMMTSGKHEEDEFFLPWKNTWIRVSVDPIFDSRGALTGCIHIVRDITESKRTRQRMITLNEQLRSLTAHLQSVREEERTMIARDIHDEFGQVLTALKMDIAWLQRRFRKDQTILFEKTGMMSGIIDGAVISMKRLCVELRPAILDDLGLAAALKWLVQEFRERSNIACDLVMEPPDPVLDKDISTAVFRICQEALTNISRHSGADTAKMTLKKDDARLVLTIEDNGKGISEEEFIGPVSFGLMGMRERALSLGGEMTIGCGIRGKGAAINLTLPVRKIQ